MAREIGTTVSGERFPLVSIRSKGNFVKGKVSGSGKTAKGNPYITMSLIDLDGSTVISPSKGVYNEVEVKVGDDVQLVGSVQDLRNKLPQLQTGDVVTITNLEGRKSIGNGRTTYNFKVEVED